MSTHDKDKNEQLTWEVNYELGILDPFVEDPEQLPGGKKSQANKWHPYQNEFEMMQSLNLSFLSETISEASWSLWIGLQMTMAKMLQDAEKMKLSTPDKVIDPNSRLSPQNSRDRARAPETIARDGLVSPDDAMLARPTAFDATFASRLPPSVSSYASNIPPLKRASYAPPDYFQLPRGFQSYSKSQNIEPDLTANVAIVPDRRISSYKTL